MASLYEIDQGILSCVDSETGEILDVDLLNQLQMERDRKIEAVCLWIKNLESDAAAFKAEAEAFKDRQTKAEAKIEKLKAWVAEACSGQKFETAKCVVSFRTSEQLRVEDKDLIPKKYCVKKVEYQPDKNLLKQIWKSGKAVKGCQLIQKLNVNIK